MPNSEEFKNLFKINVGDKIGNFTIYKSKIDEHSVVLYNKYFYNVKITLKIDGNKSKIENDFLKKVSNYKIIQLKSGRYYKCNIDNISIKYKLDKIVISCDGHSQRIKKSDI